MPATRYVENNGSAAVLSAKSSAGVTPEVNLRECVTCTPPPSTNKPRVGITEIPKLGYQWPNNKDFCPSNFF